MFAGFFMFCPETDTIEVYKTSEKGTKYAEIGAVCCDSDTAAATNALATNARAQIGRYDVEWKGKIKVSLEKSVYFSC